MGGPDLDRVEKGMFPGSAANQTPIPKLSAHRLAAIPRELSQLQNKSSFDTARGYGLEARFLFSAGTRDFSLFHSDQTGSVAHPADYPMGTAGKAAGA
jgi:hypothetical protein